MCAQFTDLPLEIAGHILAVAALQSNDLNGVPTLRRQPLSYLLINAQIYRYLVPFLYNELQFTSIDQVARFASCSSNLPLIPTSVDVRLPGGTADRRLFVLLHGALQRCLKSAKRGTNVLKLQQLRFRFNSHRCDPNLSYLYHLLALVE